MTDVNCKSGWLLAADENNKNEYSPFFIKTRPEDIMNDNGKSAIPVNKTNLEIITNVVRELTVNTGMPEIIVGRCKYSFNLDASTFIEIDDSLRVDIKIRYNLHTNASKYIRNSNNNKNIKAPLVLPVNLNKDELLFFIHNASQSSNLIYSYITLLYNKSDDYVKNMEISINNPLVPFEETLRTEDGDIINIHIIGQLHV